MKSIANFVVLLSFAFSIRGQAQYQTVASYNLGDVLCEMNILTISSTILNTCFPEPSGTSSIASCFTTGAAERTISTIGYTDNQCINQISVQNTTGSNGCISPAELSCGALLEPNFAGVQVDLFGATDCSGTVFQREFGVFALRSGDCISPIGGGSARVTCPNNDCSFCTLEAYSDEDCSVGALIQSVDFAGNDASSVCIAAPFGGFQATCTTTTSAASSLVVTWLFIFFFVSLIF